MTDNDILAFWGPGRLARWSPEALAATRLSPQAQRYLAEVGFPREVDWTMRFEAVEGHVDHLPGLPGYYVIGHDDIASLCIDARNGRVVSITPDGKERFVNSDVSQFGRFLVLYQQYRLAARHLDDTAANRVIAETERAMRDCDQASFSDSECFWAAIVEQMKAGLL